jgi:uncharacterized membrane protein
MADENTTPEQEAQTPSEQPPPAAEPAAEQPAAAPAAEESTIPEAEAAEGKAFAILSYALSLIGLPFFLVPLIMRNNAFSLFHAKQCLMLWIAGIVVGVISGLLTAVCIGPVIGLIACIALLVFCIMGLINASKGVATPLPLIGGWAEDWFKGITKA